jgi:hypothetical protein
MIRVDAATNAYFRCSDYSSFAARLLSFVGTTAESLGQFVNFKHKYCIPCNSRQVLYTGHGTLYMYRPTDAEPGTNRLLHANIEKLHTCRFAEHQDRTELRGNTSSERSSSTDESLASKRQYRKGRHADCRQRLASSSIQACTRNRTAQRFCT